MRCTPRFAKVVSMRRSTSLAGGSVLLLLVMTAAAQPPGFPGPPGGFMGQKQKLLKQFDRDGDGLLNREERQAARAFLTRERANRGPGGFGPGRAGYGPPGGRGGRGDREQPRAGPRITPAEVKASSEGSLYEPTILRTLFLDFEEQDWE